MVICHDAGVDTQQHSSALVYLDIETWEWKLNLSKSDFNLTPLNLIQPAFIRWRFPLSGKVFLFTRWLLMQSQLAGSFIIVFLLIKKINIHKRDFTIFF